MTSFNGDEEYQHEDRVWVVVSLYLPLENICSIPISISMQVSIM